MIRLISVSLVFGLLCTVACAPSSRKQQVPGSTDKKTNQPQPSPVPGAVQPSDLTPPSPVVVQNKNIDLSNVTLTNANVTADQSGAVTLSFGLKDNKGQVASSAITVDPSQKISSQDSDISALAYNCSDTSNSSVAPAMCSDGELTFTWKNISGDAKISIINDVPVNETIGTSQPKSFGTGRVVKLNLTLGDKSFSRVNGDIFASGVDQGKTPNPDDREASNDSSHVMISVFGLPKVDLDNKPITFADTLSLSSDGKQAAARIAMTPMSKDSTLQYTVGILTDSGKTPKQLILTMMLPGSVASSGDGSGVPPEFNTNFPAPDSTNVTPPLKPGTNPSAQPAPAPSAAPSGPTEDQNGTPPSPSPVQVPPPAVAPQATQPRPTQQGVTQPPPAPPAQVSTASDVNIQNFCEFDRTIGSTLIKGTIDYENGKPKVKPYNFIANVWVKNRCDASTYRLAKTGDAPNSTSCYSRNGDGGVSTQTLIFSKVNVSKPHECSVRFTEYRSTALPASGSCKVDPLGGFGFLATSFSAAPVKEGTDPKKDTGATWDNAGVSKYRFPMDLIEVKDGGAHFQMNWKDTWANLYYNPGAHDEGDRCWAKVSTVINGH